MMVLVDTCIWSLALRRDRPTDCREAKELELLIRDARVQMLGPIRQEVLSGIPSKPQFDRLKTHLAAFPDLAVETDDYVLAAIFFYLCRGKGLQGSNTDLLICAVGVRHGLAIYTTDRDFRRFAAHVPIVLYPEMASSPGQGPTPA
jgi:predicted nucleic acid-binding protein